VRPTGRRATGSAGCVPSTSAAKCGGLGGDCGPHDGAPCRKVTDQAEKLRSHLPVCRAGRVRKTDRTEGPPNRKTKAVVKRHRMNANDPHCVDHRSSTFASYRRAKRTSLGLPCPRSARICETRGVRRPRRFACSGRGLSTDRRFRAGRAGRLAGHGGRRISHSHSLFLGFCHVLRRPLDAAHLPQAEDYAGQLIDWMNRRGQATRDAKQFHSGLRRRNGPARRTPALSQKAHDIWAHHFEMNL